jgi:photosystem II stability/assembly factor-like uncharacterized protein
MKRQIYAMVTAVLISAAMLLVLLRVLAAPLNATPMVTGIDPTSNTNDSDNPIAITGADFAAVLSGTEVITAPTVYLDSTSLGGASWVSTTTLTITVPVAFPVGVYTVTVVNPDGESGSLPNGLTVQYPAPALQSLTPVSGTYGQAAMLVITGTGLVATPTIALGEIPCSVGYVSSTTLTTTVPSNLLPGVHGLTVCNPGPGNPCNALPGAFTLYSPVPTILAVSPDSAPNDLDTQVVITGTGFAPTPTVTLETTPLQNVTWVSLTQLTALVPWGMDEGTYNLTVTNPSPGVGSDMLSNAFTVTQGIGVWNASELYGGEIQQVVVNPVTPTTIYAASEQVGLFRSRDGGESWSFKLAPWADNLAIDPLSPNRIYVQGYPHQPCQFLFRSDDEGDTWIPLSTTFPITFTSAYDCWGGFGIHPHPTTPGVVYLHACDNGEGKSGLIVSTNWGEDWEPAINGLTNTQVTALAFHPDDPDIMYLGTAGGDIFRSSDGGASWIHASSPITGYVATLAVNPFGDHEVWVSSGDDFDDPCVLLKSANADLTAWTAIEPEPGQPKCAWSIDFAPTISGTVFIACFSHGYKTVNGGDTWVPFGPDLGVHDVALHPTDTDTIYLAGYTYGVHKTTDGGATWQVADQGLTAMFPEQLVTVPGHPEIVYARVFAWNGVFKSTQGSATWQFSQIADGEYGPESLLVDPFDYTRVYVGVSGRVYISTDSGDTWPTYGELAPPSQFVDCNQFPKALLGIPDQPGTLLAGVQHWCGPAPDQQHGGVYRSVDYGEHWDRVYPTGTQEIGPVNDLAYDPISPTVVYAATGQREEYAGGVFKSIDGGASWEPVGVGVIDVALDVAVEPGTHRVFVSKGCCLPLYVSNDGGSTWTPTGYGGGHNVHDLLFAPSAAPGGPPVLYDAAAQGLYRSTDGAQSWSRAAGMLGYVPVYSLAVVTATDRVILYAGTTGGNVQNDRAQILDTANSDGALVNAGVYRYTTRLPTERVYLPVVLRAYEQQLSLQAPAQGPSSRPASKAEPSHPSSKPHNSAYTRPALRAVLISGALMFVASAVVMVSLHKAARAGDADRPAVRACPERSRRIAPGRTGRRASPSGSAWLAALAAAELAGAADPSAGALRAPPRAADPPPH